MARWAYRWNQNRGLKSPSGCVSVSFEILRAPRRGRDASGFRVIREAFLHDGNRESRGESPQDLDASVCCIRIKADHVAYNGCVITA